MEFATTETRENSITALKLNDKNAIGISIEVEHVSYWVAAGSQNESKYILKDINFNMTPGTMTALMGPSGAGKR